MASSHSSSDSGTSACPHGAVPGIGDGEIVDGSGSGGSGPKVINIKYDVFYRAGDGDPSSFTHLPAVGNDEEEFEVKWERKNLLFEKTEELVQSDGKKGSETGLDMGIGDEGDESEEDPETMTFIKDFMKRKKKGGNLTGEFIYYDESICCVRNIHCSSFSLTEYEAINYKDFGRKKAMHAIMTEEEKASTVYIIKIHFLIPLVK